MANKKIVCLGGGIGTVNLIKGLKEYTNDLSVVSSMVDDGGSSGRLRRIYGILPPGDLISCMAAIGNKNNEYLSKLLTYRFPGNRYGDDLSLEGQKLGNLILTGIYKQNGDFIKSIKIFQEIFGIPGNFYPDTLDNTSLSAQLKNGTIIEGEEIIELGKYRGNKDIDRIFITPDDAKTCPQVLSVMENADAIIVGPGDVYSNNMPVLVIKEISSALKKSKARKLLIVDVANKPFEARDYKVSDYINAFDKHIGGFPFGIVLVNNNHSVKIPYKYRKYEYVKEFGTPNPKGFKVIKADLLDESFPLYHDPAKLAKSVIENI